MKTIEQRATEYACDDGVMPDSPECESCFNIYGKCTRDAYIAGANAEHKELTRWHDPKDELPEYYMVVEIKYKALGKIMISTASRCYNNGFYIDGTNRLINPLTVVGWREIHE